MISRPRDKTKFFDDVELLQNAMKTDDTRTFICSETITNKLETYFKPAKNSHQALVS